MPISEYDWKLIKEERRIPLGKRLARTGIPVTYLGKTWADYEHRDATEHLREALRDYAEQFKTTSPPMHGGKGLLIQGPPGVGKTMAACLLGVELLGQGFYIRFITLAGYTQTLIRQITLQQAWQRYESLDAFEEWDRTDDALRALRETAHLVIVDDVGKEHKTASNYAVDSFDEFLRDRVNLGRPVVMTSNVSIDKWTERYSEAMASFVRQAATVISVETADDMRRVRR